MKPITFFLLYFLSVSAFAQDSIRTKEIDSLYYSDKISVGVFDKSLADSLEFGNKLHPYQLYSICGSFCQDSMLNEAAVVYFIAKSRYSFYNKTNPNYEASGDGALAGGFSSIFGSVLTSYLRENLDNFGEVVKFSASWYKENEYFYFDHPENDSLYQLQTNAMFEFSETLLDHPEEYIRELEKVRKEFDAQMKELEKELEEEEFDDMPSED